MKGRHKGRKLNIVEHHEQDQNHENNTNRRNFTNRINMIIIKNKNP
jgi:hypothetical protein